MELRGKLDRELKANRNWSRGRSDRARTKLGSELEKFLTAGLEGAQVVGWWEVGRTGWGTRVKSGGGVEQNWAAKLEGTLVAAW